MSMFIYQKYRFQGDISDNFRHGRRPSPDDRFPKGEWVILYKIDQNFEKISTDLGLKLEETMMLLCGSAGD